jgi:hypothetical protein
MHGSEEMNIKDNSKSYYKKSNVKGCRMLINDRVNCKARAKNHR